jgi:hypothetical protein
MTMEHWLKDNWQGKLESLIKELVRCAYDSHHT